MDLQKVNIFCNFEIETRIRIILTLKYGKYEKNFTWIGHLDDDRCMCKRTDKS